MLTVVADIDGDWRDLAQCQGADTRDFYPEGADAAVPVIALWCERCPVRAQCDEHAQAAKEQGVWGARYRTGMGSKAFTRAEIEAGAGRPGARKTGAVSDGYGECRSCAVVRKVRLDGTIGSHWIAGLGGRVQCPGVGYQPRAAS